MLYNIPYSNDGVGLTDHHTAEFFALTVSTL